ncbi:MAG TPA: hypothetical protein VMD30_03085, partial [Tepidisphaeraceae bacterium]|nr:hypothetical protein [Tepidisphaeraceae bacterium]
MNEARIQLRRTIGALRRRAGLVRTLECAGIGLIAGSTGVLALMMAHPAWEAIAACLVGGFFAGGAWGIASRPTFLQTAMMADRQMGTRELLSTAWMVTHVRRPSAVDLENVVVSMAEVECRQCDLRAIHFSRFSGRAWGGIALLAIFSVAV